MFLKFSDEAQKLLLLSLKEKNKLNDSMIGTEHVFLAALSMKNSYICKILNDNRIFYNDFYVLLSKKENNSNSGYYVFTPLMKDIFNNLSSNNKKNLGICPSDIVFEILNSSNSKVMLLLKKMNVDIKSLLKELNVDNKKKKSIKKGLLNEIGINLNEKGLENNDVVLERDKEINMIVEILCCKNKNNPILLGDAGVGKTAIVEELARRVAIGDVPMKLRNKKIYSVSMSSLVAGTKYRGEFEEKINKLILEVESNDDIILFIDEIHTLVGAGGADGAIDASNILKPSLARGNIKIIGATTNDEYKKYFSNDKALSRRFQIVNVLEPDINKVKTILYGIKGLYEKFHGVVISNDILDKIIYYSDKYIPMRKFPDKAIDILDEVCVLASISLNKDYSSIISLDKKLNELVNLKNQLLINGDYKKAIKYSQNEREIQSKISKMQVNALKKNKNIEVDEQVLLKVMERKTNIPFFAYKFKYNELLKKVKMFKINSIFLDDVVNKISDFTLDMYSNLINNGTNNSIGICSSNYGINNYFIKEYINYFYDKCNLIQIDINNFRNIDSLLKNNEYYNKDECLIDKIKLNPFSIIVIDNYNNADFSIREFFDKINKYGYYVDKNNEKVDFSNVLFIYNILENNIGMGFNKNIKEIDNFKCFRIGEISNIKLKKKIKSICINNKYSFNKDLIDSVYNKIINNNDNLYNIDFLIRKEISNNKRNYNKSRTIKV